MPEGHSTAFSKDFLQLNWAEEKLKYICLRALKTFSPRQANILLKNNYLGKEKPLAKWVLEISAVSAAVTTTEDIMLSSALIIFETGSCL